jgi:D-tyrosyl-tRNA(Tyr) deacylase
MKAVIQRVASASVSIDGNTCGSIGPGLLVLLGIAPEDTPEDGDWLARKIARLRIFSDSAGQMNLSVDEINGGLLVISQFTLFARTRKGTRPSFNDAAPPETALPLYRKFLEQIEAARGGRPVQAGVFGALMQISLVNNGPVTLIIDTRQRD